VPRVQNRAPKTERDRRVDRERKAAKRLEAKLAGTYVRPRYPKYPRVTLADGTRVVAENLLVLADPDDFSHPLADCRAEP
jgi:hypothetical protein